MQTRNQGEPASQKMLPLPANSTPVLYVARHGRTVLNASNSFRGNANPPLDSVGIKQAEELHKIFEPIELSHIFCSPKIRSTKTAEIISKDKHIPLHKVDSLQALNVGKFSGQKRDRESEAALQKYLDDPDTVIPDGESLNQFKSRVTPCLQQAIEMFSKCGVPSLFVAHSSVCHEVGSILYGDHKSILVEPGGVIAVYFDGSKLQAKPIHKPMTASKTKAGTIT